MEHYSSVESLKNEIKELQEELKQKERLLEELLRKDNDTIAESKTISTNEIIRYSRQMIMPDITIDGQKALKNSKVLIVGVGGLGCPAALYLATAGIVDYDEVELSNLHRQVLHSEDDIGVPKVMSAYNKLKRINSDIKIIPIREHANSKTIENLLHNNKYDVVIDGTDNVATRYLLNDICVLHNTPLVSGSALQMEGQLTVYHYRDGPCYRCLFPVPPPAHTVTNCGDGGVLGPVPGTIGVLQALETIKIITQSAGVLSGRFLIFDGSTSMFRNVRLRPRNPKCDVCGDEPTITTLIDYEQFCGSSAHDKVININILDKEQEVDINKFCVLKECSVVIDVRPELEFKMCSLSHTLNYPYTKILKDLKEFQTFLEDNLGTSNNVFILCRRGNDSQRAVCYIKDKMGTQDINFYNVKGGLHAYSKIIDPSFPIY
ncbi:unnamed protein product [Diabrotica balteata]|uniref:Adenylyltransferase and sulfurtransferase MOCS3 homolog n=1 Tax=Diabrotica balteata TaxID=107213 RepID=A0A9N9X3W6_DIABA|nr:unnamed protein product [Diabrotica balteata]